jgi:hypothetical protein
VTCSACRHAWIWAGCGLSYGLGPPGLRGWLARPGIGGWAASCRALSRAAVRGDTLDASGKSIRARLAAVLTQRCGRTAGLASVRRPRGRSRAGRCIEAFGRSAGSRGLRRMALDGSQLSYGHGKLGELRDEHHHRGLVLLARRCRECEQPGGGPQPVPGRCRPGNATVATAGRAGVAVCCLPERPAIQDVRSDMQGVSYGPGRIGGRCRIGEGARPDRAGGSGGSITCSVPDVAAFLGDQPRDQDARAAALSSANSSSARKNFTRCGRGVA